ncbi:MAG: phosphoribosylglycinamide formyltransferase [Candidatus Poribacteria bacterium]|nr:phosphoribosylglycinamide formyltransferase [Candidatus Poribacteria bacterium]
MKIAVLASGSGSNLQALIDRVHTDPDAPVEIALVLCDRYKAHCLDRAKAAGIPTAVVRARDYPTREAFDDAIDAQLNARGVELIVLAGFMKLFQSAFVRRWDGRIVNTHPALSPAFPGAHSARDALEYGAKVTGVTFHFVDEGVDSGPVIAQFPIPIERDDTEETLMKRIQAVEHRMYPEVVRAMAEGRVRLEGRRVTVEPSDFRWTGMFS